MSKAGFSQTRVSGLTKKRVTRVSGYPGLHSLLRTRQDSISYSFIYIVQKLETVDRDRGTPKLLRNWGTMKLRNYSEIMDRDYGITKKLLRNHSEIEDHGTMELLRKLWLAIVLY